MTREVASYIGLPVSKYMDIDSGDYAENVVHVPVPEKMITFTDSSGYTDYWDFRDEIKNHANYHPDVVYAVAFKAQAVGAGLVKFTSWIDQYVFVDTVADMHFFWIPKSGAQWGNSTWSLLSGSISITDVYLIPCITAVIGAGFEDLDTNADEGDSVIGRLRYTPVPEFIDVGSCKLYSQPDGDRIYAESGLPVEMTGYAQYGVDFDNGLIKVQIRLDKFDSGSNHVTIQHNRFGVWEWYGKFYIGTLANDPYVWLMEIKTNSRELVHIHLRAGDEEIDIRLRRGEHHVEMETTNQQNISVYAPEIGWNGDFTTDPLRDGIVCGLYTTDRTEEFELDQSTPTNHYLIMQNRGEHAFYYLASLGNRASMVAHTSESADTIDWLQTMAYQVGYSPIAYFGSTLFPDMCHWEAEDGTLGGTAVSEADANAYDGNRVKLPAQGDSITLNFTKWEGYLPDGLYSIAIRTWYSGAVSADLQVYVEDVTGAQSLYNQSLLVTTESFYGEEWLVVEDNNFAFSGDNHYRITLTRIDSNAGDLYVDAIIFLPKTRINYSKQFPMFPEGEKGVATMTLKEAKQNPEYDKRR